MDSEQPKAAGTGPDHAAEQAAALGGPAGDTRAPGAAAAEAVEAERHALTIHMLECATSSTFMEEHYEWLQRLATGVSILASTAAGAALLGLLGAVPLGPGVPSASAGLIANLLVVGLGVSSLVFDFGGRARLHRDQMRRYMTLYADLLTAPDAALTGLRASLIKIIADGPTVPNVVRAKAYNSVLRGLYGDAEYQAYRIPIRWWQALLGAYILSIRLDDARKPT